jgi:hypothetical protein
MPGVVEWLLEADNPSARYLVMTALLDRSEGDPDTAAARAAVPTQRQARAILNAQWPEGYWMHPGVGYSPKYKASVWQVIFLAQLGVPRAPATDRACGYLLDNARLPNGLFTADRTARGAIPCLSGNLLRAMRQLGCVDPRLEESTEALAQAVVRDEFRCWCNAKPRAARMRDALPCAWGAVKALGAFAELPADRRSPAVRSAVEGGVALLLGGDLACGGYSAPGGPSPLWLKLGFPLAYASDLLEALEVLLRLGVGRQPSLQAAVDLVTSRRDGAGRWALEYTPHNTWSSFGPVGRPNKWVTLRALRVLKAWG